MHTTPAVVTLAVVLGAVSNVSANHYHELEDTAYELLRDARAVRWAVRESCSYVGDYRELVRQSDEMYAHVLHLQEVLLEEQPFSVVCEEVDHIEQSLRALDARLRRCSYGVGYRPLHSGRHVFVSPCPTGSRHGIEWQVNRMTATLRDLHVAAHHLAGGIAVPPESQPYYPENSLPSFAVPGAPVPGVTVPRGVAPQGPQFYGTPALPVPSVNQSTRSYTLPLRFGGKQGLVVRFGG